MFHVYKSIGTFHSLSLVWCKDQIGLNAHFLFGVYSSFRISNHPINRLLIQVLLILPVHVSRSNFTARHIPIFHIILYKRTHARTKLFVRLHLSPTLTRSPVHEVIILITRPVFLLLLLLLSLCHSFVQIFLAHVTYCTDVRLHLRLRPITIS